MGGLGGACLRGRRLHGAHGLRRQQTRMAAGPGQRCSGLHVLQRSSKAPPPHRTHPPTHPSHPLYLTQHVDGEQLLYTFRRPDGAPVECGFQEGEMLLLSVDGAWWGAPVCGGGKELLKG